MLVDVLDLLEQSQQEQRAVLLQLRIGSVVAVHLLLHRQAAIEELTLHPDTESSNLFGIREAILGDTAQDRAQCTYHEEWQHVAIRCLHTDVEQHVVVAHEDDRISDTCVRTIYSTATTVLVAVAAEGRAVEDSVPLSLQEEF